jgi:hypothetical protein
MEPPAGQQHDGNRSGRKQRREGGSASERTDVKGG